MKPHNCLYVNNVTLTKISNHQPCGRKGVRNAFEIDQIGQSVALTIVTDGENNAEDLGHLHHRCYVTCRQIRPRFLN